MILRTFILSFKIGFQTAFIEMGTNRLRSLLSLFGVLLGVASLVAMLTLIGGIDTFVKKKLGRWIGTIWIFAERDEPDPDERIAWSRSPGLRLSDGDYLEARSPAVREHLASIRRWGRLRVAGVRIDGHVRGVDSASFADDLRLITLRHGRFFSEDDYREGPKVCLISWKHWEEAAEKFESLGRDTMSILGSFVTVKNVNLKIIGVFDPIDPDWQPWHLGDQVALPLRTMQRYITGLDPNPGRLQLELADPGDLKNQAETVARSLRARHRGARDFDYRTAEWADNMRAMMRNISLLMGIVSIISLSVGGLSIMNVMLSSISERIKEIGVRKALGVQNGQIFIQFLAETITLSFFGGVAGTLLGLIPLLFKEAIKKSTEGSVEPTILPMHMIFVFAIIVLIGIVFGIYPAVKASRMDPIEALRYE